MKNTIGQPRGNGNAIYILYYIKNIVHKDGKRITCFATPYLVSGFFSSLIPSFRSLQPPTEVRRKLCLAETDDYHRESELCGSMAGAWKRNNKG